MKKLLSVLLCMAMLLTAAAVTVSAEDLSADVNDGTWGDVELKGLVYVQGGWFASDLAENYDNDEWYYVDEMDVTGGTFETYAQVNMRGFTMAPDRKFAYMGFLNGGSNFRGCAMFDMETGSITDVYYRYDTELEDRGDDTLRFSFAKGLAADDRGYVYVGFALSANYNLVTLGIAKANYETKKLEHITNVPVYEFGTPGVQEGGIHVGVNGVDVAKVGDRYLCYSMINYDADRIVCMDVTNPAQPELYKEFGVDGVLELGADSSITTIDDGYYMDVESDGTLWLACKAKDGSAKVLKFAPDGSALAGSFDAHSAYAVSHAGHYLVVATKDGSAIDVYDDASFEKVNTVQFDSDSYGTYFSMVQVIDDILFVADSDNNDTGSYNAIMAAALTPDAQAKLDEMVEALNGKKAGEQETETTAENDTEIDTQEDATVVTEADSQADSEPVTDANTEAGSDANTAATGDEGCQSVIGVSVIAAVIIAGLGFMMGKKH